MAKKVMYGIRYLLTGRTSVFQSSCHERVDEYLKSCGFVILRDSGGIYIHSKSRRLAKIVK